MDLLHPQLQDGPSVLAFSIRECFNDGFNMILYWRVPVIQPGYLKTDMDHLMIRNNPVIGILTLMKLVEVQ